AFVRLRRDEPARPAFTSFWRGKQVTSCAGHRRREHCVLSAMLTVSHFQNLSPAGRSSTTSPSRSIAAIGLNFSPDPLTVRNSVFTFLPYGSDNYFSSDKKASGMDRAFSCANGGFARAVHSLAFR